MRLGKSYDRRINKLRNGGFLNRTLASYNLKDWQENPAQATQGQLRERQP